MLLFMNGICDQQVLLPSLTVLDFAGGNIALAGAAALAAVLQRGALSSSQDLILSYNNIADDGLKALAAPLRKHPNISENSTSLAQNGIGDEGIAALLAPEEGVLAKLSVLILRENVITDVGCTMMD